VGFPGMCSTATEWRAETTQLLSAVETQMIGALSL
jgi:hypothetical protein